MSHRNIEHLHRNRIEYRKDPETDIPTEKYHWGSYYQEGTYQCYELFRSTAKITTYKSLKWHMIVLRYMNLKLDDYKFEKIIYFMCDVRNGFVTFAIHKNFIDKMIMDVFSYDFSIPPRNRLRKIIFKDSTGMSKKKKLKIVGQFAGRNKCVNNENIYECMLHINHSNKRITISNLAKTLDCSSRTIHRNMDLELKKEKELLNNQYEKV